MRMKGLPREYTEWREGGMKEEKERGRGGGGRDGGDGGEG